MQSTPFLSSLCQLLLCITVSVLVTLHSQATKSEANFHEPAVNIVESIPESVLKRIKKRNAKQIKRRMFDASELNIVKLDIESLKKNSMVSFSPFGTDNLVLSAESISAFGDSTDWIGYVKTPAWQHQNKDQLPNRKPRHHQPVDLHIFLNGKKVKREEIEKHDDRKKFEAAKRLNFNSKDNVDQNYRQGDRYYVEDDGSKREYVFSVYGTIVSRSKNQIILIRPLKKNPRYSIVYTLDPNKVVIDSDSNEAKFRKAEYSKYLKKNKLEIDPDKDED